MDPIFIKIKAVPGASSDQVASMLGDRLKVRISAPPEAGKANKAIRALIANTLKIKAACVEIESGHTSPEKTIRISHTDYPSEHSVLNQLLQ